MNYLIDTHVWIWMNSFPELLSARVRRKLESLEPSDSLLISAISLWEVCKLVEKKKIHLVADLEAWVQNALEMPRLRVVPLDFPVFLRSTTLPGRFHADPADQMIVAAARLNDAVIITKDRQIRNYRHVRTFW